MSDLNSCYSCVFFSPDDHACSNYHGAEKYPEHIDNPEKEKPCFDLDPWIAKERLIKAQAIIEIQTKRVENLKKSNEFYANRKSWRKQTQTTNGLIVPEDQWDGKFKIGGKLARSCQEIDQELEKQLEEMSKLSDEQIEAAYIKWFKENCHKYCVVDGLTTFKVAFTLLMPIIEKQMEALQATWPGEFGAVVRAHHDKALQETKQMLEQLGEKK